MVKLDTYAPARACVEGDGYNHSVTFYGATLNIVPAGSCIAWSEGEQFIRTDTYDCGEIVSQPSQLEGCNDCWHYDVEGDGSRRVQPYGLQLKPKGVNSDVYVASVEGKTIKLSTNWLGGLWTLGETKALKCSLVDKSIDMGYWWRHGRVSITDVKLTLTQTNPRVILSYSCHCKLDYWTDWGSGPQDRKIYTEEDSGELRFVYGAGSWVRGEAVEFQIPPAETADRTDMPYYWWHEDPFNLSSLLRFFEWTADEEYDFGMCSREAAESIRLVNINTLQYGREALEFGELAKQIVSLTKPVKGVKTVGKALAGAYLLGHYGLRLTVKDTEEISEAIDSIDLEHSLQTMGASHKCTFDYPGRDDTTVVCETRMKAVVDCFSESQKNYVDWCKKTNRALYELDLVPTLSNLWDIVPYSFVADWFIPIGDALENIEIQHYAQSLNVYKAFYSRKYTWSYTDRFTTDNGTSYEVALKFKYYRRLCQKTLITPSLRVDSPLRSLPSHWLEASAIILTSI